MIHLQGDISAVLAGREMAATARHVYLLRHGETDLNARGIVQGAIETDLNATGRAQAEAVMRDLRALSLNRILSSPQRRAMQTADIIGAGLGLPVATSALLRERSWGVHEGRPHQEATPEGAGVEPLAALQARAILALRQIISDPESRTLTVTHGGLIRAMIAVLGCGYSARVGNCAVLSVSLSGG